MRKILTVALTLALLLCLVACGNKQTQDNSTQTNNVVNSVRTDAFGEFAWPNSEIASLLPKPKSTIGEFSWERSDGFWLEVGETSFEDYEEYVTACMDNGFNVDYTREETWFRGVNSDGYELSVDYYDDDDEKKLMVISISEPTAEDQSTEIFEPTPVASSVSSTISTESLPEQSIPTVTVGWETFLVEYEAWVDSYISFMQKYNENPADPDILNDYMDLIDELTEWTQKEVQMQEDLANYPEALNTYIETLTRITQKLNEAMYA